MSWKSQLRSDSLPWLLESENPGVRYLALRDLFDLSPDDKKLKTARMSAHKEGPIAEVLSHMKKDGYCAEYEVRELKDIFLVKIGGGHFSRFVLSVQLRQR